MQQRNLIDHGLKRLLLVTFILLALVGSRSSHAENISQVLQWISGIGDFNQDASGATNIPPAVLSSVSRGQVSPILQLTLTQGIMTKCTKKAIKDDGLTKTMAYIEAAKEFNDGICKINKCFQNALMISFLPQLSNNQTFGGSSSEGEREGALTFLLSMMQSFKKANSGCGDGGGSGIDSTLILLLQQAGGGNAGSFAGMF